MLTAHSLPVTTPINDRMCKICILFIPSSQTEIIANKVRVYYSDIDWKYV